jgi:hypothetical protein
VQQRWLVLTIVVVTAGGCLARIEPVVPSDPTSPAATASPSEIQFRAISVLPCDPSGATTRSIVKPLSPLSDDPRTVAERTAAAFGERRGEREGSPPTPAFESEPKAFLETRNTTIYVDDLQGNPNAPTIFAAPEWFGDADTARGRLSDALVSLFGKFAPVPLDVQTLSDRFAYAQVIVNLTLRLPTPYGTNYFVQPNGSGSHYVLGPVFAVDATSIVVTPSQAQVMIRDFLECHYEDPNAPGGDPTTRSLVGPGLEILDGSLVYTFASHWNESCLADGFRIDAVTGALISYAAPTPCDY